MAGFLRIQEERLDKKQRLKFLKAFNNSDGTDKNMKNFVRGYLGHSDEGILSNDVIQMVLAYTICLNILYDKDCLYNIQDIDEYKVPIAKYFSVYPRLYKVYEGGMFKNWVRKEWKIKILAMEDKSCECIEFSIGIIGHREEDKPLAVDVGKLNLRVGDVLSMLYWFPRGHNKGRAMLSFAVNNIKTNKISLSRIEPKHYRLCVILKNHAEIQLQY